MKNRKLSIIENPSQTLGFHLYLKSKKVDLTHNRSFQSPRKDYVEIDQIQLAKQAQIDLERFYSLPERYPQIYKKIEAQIIGYPQEKECDKIFNTLDLIKNAGSSKVEKFHFSSDRTLLSVLRIPHLLHYIWLGSDLPEKYFPNLAHYSSKIQKEGGLCILWTDRKAINDSKKRFLEENQIKLIHVDILFGEENALSLFQIYKIALSAFPSNYGEASDILRIEILERFGGYYMDCDNPAEEYNFESLIKKGDHAKLGFVSGYKWLEKKLDVDSDIRGNDLIGSVPKSKLTKRIKLIILKNCHHLPGTIFYTQRPEIIDLTITKTGPVPLMAAIKTLSIEYEKEHFMDSESQILELKQSYYESSNGCTSDLGWVHSKFQKRNLNFEDSVELTDLIFHDLEVSLLYFPETLDLLKYIPYIEQGNYSYYLELILMFITENKILIERVNRVFWPNKLVTTELMQKIETILGREVEWNYSSMLKVAILVDCTELIDYLTDINKKSLLENSVEDHAVGYNVHHYSPMGVMFCRDHILGL